MLTCPYCGHGISGGPPAGINDGALCVCLVCSEPAIYEAGKLRKANELERANLEASAGYRAAVNVARIHQANLARWN